MIRKRIFIIAWLIFTCFLWAKVSTQYQRIAYLESLYLPGPNKLINQIKCDGLPISSEFIPLSDTAIKPKYYKIIWKK